MKFNRYNLRIDLRLRFDLGMFLLTHHYYLVIVLLANMLGSISGIHLQLMALSQYQMSLLAGIILLGTLFGCLPAYKAYRYALSDGLTIKV